MDALNAASLTPLSVLSERKTEPRKTPSNPTLSPPKVLNFSSLIKSPSLFQNCLSRNFHGSLALASSVLSGSYAKALTYEEALEQSVSPPTPIPSSDFDPSSILDGLVGFATENPLLVASGAAILALPFVLSQAFGKPKSFGVESAKIAYSKLGDDATAQLLDIRPAKELREVGTPDVRGLGKKPVSVVYRGEDKNGFLKKLVLKFKKPENTTLFILDKFDGNAELVAELVTVNGFKAAYAIKDGAEGPRGWMNSGLPWTAPKKALSFDLSDLTENITEAFGDGFDALTATIGIAAAAGIGLFAFTEVETILQLLGSAALVQIFSKKLLFAEDREKTLKEVDEFLNTKIAPKELVGDLKVIGKAFLPSPLSNKALPEPAEAAPDYSMVQKAEAAPEQKVEAAAQLAPEINSVPKAEVKTDALSGFSRPLSPYPSYPDFKPPTSPSPSQP